MNGEGDTQIADHLPEYIKIRVCGTKVTYFHQISKNFDRLPRWSSVKNEIKKC